MNKKNVRDDFPNEIKCKIVIVNRTRTRKMQNKSK